MRQQLNIWSFNNLQVEQYEVENSNPSHFFIRNYDKQGLQVDTHSSELYKHNFSFDFSLEEQPPFQKEQVINEPSTNNEQTQKNSDSFDSPSVNHQIESFSAPDSRSNDSSTVQTSPKSHKKAKKREDNNNNAHKSFTTLLNEACKDCGILKILKKTLKQRKIAFNKGSRQAFIIRLIQISLAFPNLKNKIHKYFLKRLEKSFNQEKNDPASLYLKGLKTVYRKAVELFYQGRVIQATQWIYQIQNAKQKKKKDQGIKKVKDFMKENGYP